jgi:hypothetical protein
MDVQRWWTMAVRTGSRRARLHVPGHESLQAGRGSLLGVFVDSHTRAEISMDAFLRALEAAELGIPNADGACPIDFLVAPGGRMTCITEAPSASAVERLHEQLGLPQPSVVPVAGAEGGRPLSDHDHELVISLIGG